MTPMQWKSAILCGVLLAAGWGGMAGAQPVEISNPSFETGSDAPTGWTLSGGVGEWLKEGAEGNRAIAVTGSGGTGDSNYWRTPSLDLEPMGVYVLRFQGKRIPIGGDKLGCPISGPVFANRDLSSDLIKEWRTFTMPFVAPSTLTPQNAWLRFGQWEERCKNAFDDISLVRATPVYRTANGIALGEGERIKGATYTFRAPLDGASYNQARPLTFLDCLYNRPRLVFGAGNTVIYRHTLPGVRHTRAEVRVRIGWYQSGEIVVETSIDDNNWTEIGTAGSLGEFVFPLPGSLFPAESVAVRLRSQARNEVGANSDPGSLQVFGYEFQSALDRAPGDLTGQTAFVSVEKTDPRLHVELESLGDCLPGGENVCVARIENLTSRTLNIAPGMSVSSESRADAAPGATLALSPGEQEIRVPYDIRSSGDLVLAFALGGESPYRAETRMTLSPLFESRYGECLPGSTDAVGLWWASSGWKVARSRPLPGRTGPALRVAMARNETEAAQLVVRPARALKEVTFRCGNLSGPNGTVLPAESIDLLRVGYVPVTQPSDNVGVAAPWPDPLPPFTGAVDLDAGVNQPVWVRVHAPRDAVAGVYRGAIVVEADGYRAEAPIEVDVFDFTLPERMSCSTAFGFNGGRAFDYQGVKTEGDRRAVFEKYLATHSAHHISPYDPAQLDGFRVSWPGQSVWSGGLRDHDEKHAGETSIRIVDDSPNQTFALRHDATVAIPAEGFRLRFWYRTATPGHRFNVAMGHFDEGGQWMSGRNRDVPVEGSGDWQLFDQTFITFPEGAVSANLAIHATLWTETGENTGTLWIDDLALSDAGTGEVLMESGFEPLTTEDLTPEFDWTAWDAAMERAIDRYHFNAFTVPIQGMGGGTFASRVEPSLFGYGEDTPEYQAAFRAYCRGIESHLAEKGWLDEAFVYWFDEPDPKDYEFVMCGFQRLKEAAPGLRRMLTEQVEPALVGGPNIWCPLSAFMDFEQVKKRQAAGDKIWWYVCTAPKAPFATLFIDHPATDLRVWLWQTWQRGIDGILIWETNYWNSPIAYPDSLQNPYEDPMGWVSGYGVGAGERMPWGNGDGRFVYPPESAAAGRPAQPVLDAPVDSIRIEMLRDGIEDYEYLAMLKRLLEAKGGTLSEGDRSRFENLLKVPESITVDLTTFTVDPAPIERRREEVARALEELAKL